MRFHVSSERMCVSPKSQAGLCKENIRTSGGEAGGRGRPTACLLERRLQGTFRMACQWSLTRLATFRRRLRETCRTCSSLFVLAKT